MRKLVFLVIILFSASFNCLADVSRPSTKKEVFFKGTNHELEVYHIHGRQDGPTMLIVGGIQGDEPGGFLSADSYADITLEKGNLIVIPRMNLYSILLSSRETHGVDMNRLFHKAPNNWQGDVVNKIKKYMQEADIFLNLHDGWGFHYPKHINWHKSPDRFGYSVIVDEEEYKCSNGIVLKLGETAKKAMDRANAKIPKDDPKKQYFNTETSREDGKFKSMQKSATWYAVESLCLPSFAIEGSKNMDLEKNVLYHNYVINEFMEIAGIIPEYPRLPVYKAVFKGAVIDINGEERFARDKQIISIPKGSIITITEIVSNYERGLSCDIMNFDNLNDIDKPYKLEKTTKVIFRKDDAVIGSVTLKPVQEETKITKENKNDIEEKQVKEDKNKSQENEIETKKQVVKEDSQKEELQAGIIYFYINKNGKAVSIKSGDSLTVKKNDVIEFIKVYSKDNDNYNYAINFKGWFAAKDAVNNNGDDRGYKIKFPTDRMLKKYSIEGKGKIYPVDALKGSINKKTVATMYIEME